MFTTFTRLFAFRDLGGEHRVFYMFTDVHHVHQDKHSAVSTQHLVPKRGVRNQEHAADFQDVQEGHNLGVATINIRHNVHNVHDVHRVFIFSSLQAVRREPMFTPMFTMFTRINDLQLPRVR